MNIKKLKPKQIVALALALFMVVPTLLVAMPIVKATNPIPYLSIVPHGQTTGSQGTTNFAALTTGQTFSVDVRVDNYFGTNIGGANDGVSYVSYTVHWDPTVLKETTKSDISWLPDQSNMGDVAVDNTNGYQTIGQLCFGSDSQEAADSSTGSVSATLTFQVLSTGSTGLTLQPSDVGVAYLRAPETVDNANHDVIGTLTYNALYNPVTAISLYQSGTSTNIIQLSGNPIGQSFTVDVYINNPLAVNIWSWNLGVTWNAAALQLTQISEGSFMIGGTSTMFVPGYVDNNAGNTPQGISDVYLDDVTTNAPAGVLATLTFQVINYANSNINLVAGIPTLQTITGNTPSAITPAPVLSNAQYITSPPPAPTSPVAKIANPDTSPITVYTNGYTIPNSFNPNAPIDLSASQSLPGNDVVPNPSTPTFAISTYQWTVTQGSSLLTLTNPSAEAISFNAPTVSSLTTFTLQLVVSTAANAGDQLYNPVSTPVTLSFTVAPPYTNPNSNGAQVDLYVVNPTTGTTTNPIELPNGAGANAACDAFGPQEQMNLAAFVTFNGASVANKEVAFQISDNHGNVIATVTALTGENGIATTSYRLPWFDGSYTSGPQSEFGTWNVYASVEVQQTIVSDTMPFDFGDIISITGVTVASSILPRSTTTTTTDNSLTVGLSGISNQLQAYYITYTVYDAGNVPIATGLIQGTMAAATYTGTGSAATAGTFTVTSSTASKSASFAIPSYAFVGGATVKVDVFNADPLNAQNKANPANNAIAYCPEVPATFTIAIPFS